MRVEFPVTAMQMATAMAIAARDDESTPSYSGDSWGPEYPEFVEFVEGMSRAAAMAALRDCFYAYGEGMCWPDDWPASARNRAFEIVTERGWA